MTHDKYEALLACLGRFDSLLVAYSGGVDSTLLAFAAHAVLGARCTAALAVSDVSTQHEIDEARAVARGLGLNLLEVETYELADPRFTENTPERCYYCKSELFGLLVRVADANGLEAVADGSNVDDRGDFRPGTRALRELGVVSPLQDAGLTKADIRTIAHELSLPNWDKPAAACLATRVPYGEPLDEGVLARIAEAESSLRDLGLSQFRVRVHGDVARIEVAPADMDRAWEMRKQVAAGVREAGFAWVAQDLDGYRTGALNETLTQP